MVPSVAAVVCFAVLATAGAGHLRHLGTFRAAIRAHAVWPAALTAPLAAAVAALEIGLGTVGITSVAVAAEALQPSLLAAAAALYGCYAIYGGYLLTRRPGTPCACSSDMQPIDISVIGRAAVLAGLACVALALAPVGAGLSATEVAVTALASTAYAVVLWSLPAALRDPFAAIGAGDVRQGG